MSAYQEVEAVLSNYFDALYECDPEKIRAVFHEQAVYATADETPALIRDLPTYVEVIASRESPSSRGEQRHDRIDGIEVAGENTARARVRCTFGGRDFVDYLTLIRDAEGWRIIAKVFQIRAQGEQ
jgi:hypothetical protein